VPTFNVTAYGAVGGGVTPTPSNTNWTAFQAAIDAAAAAGGGEVIVPLDRYRFDNSTLSLELKPNVWLHGDIRGPFDLIARDPISATVAPTLLITNLRGTANGGFPFEGFIICDGFEGYVTDLCFAYPDQQVPVADTTVPFSPTIYPWTITDNFSYVSPGASNPFSPGVYVERCTIFNATNGLRLGAGRSGAKDCIVGAYDVCVQVDNAADSNKYENLRLAPVWDDAYNFTNPVPASNADVYCASNQTGFLIGRSDGFQITSCGMEGGLVAFDVYRNGSVGAYGEITNCFAEAQTYVFRLRGATNPNGIRVVGGDFVLQGQFLYQIVGGTAVVAGDTVSTTLTSPGGTVVGPITYTATAADAAQPTLIARQTAVANGLAALVNASAAVTGAGAFAGTVAVSNTGANGAVLRYYSVVPGGNVNAVFQANTSTVVSSASPGTAGHVTVSQTTSSLVTGTWFKATSAANGSLFAMDGTAVVFGLPSTIYPQNEANGLYLLKAINFNGSANAPGTGPLGIQTGPSTGPFTYYNVTFGWITVGWEFGTNTVVYLGSTVTAANRVGGGPRGSVRVPPGGGVTFDYTAGGPPTIYPYSD